MRRWQGGLGKRKTELTAEVSCQGDTLQRCCTDGMTGGSKRSIWRSWKGTGENGKAENSSGGRILKGCHKPPLWLSPFLLFFSLLLSFLFIAWESLSRYVTQVVTMSHHGHGHKSRHMVTW